MGTHLEQLPCSKGSMLVSVSHPLSQDLPPLGDTTKMIRNELSISLAQCTVYTCHMLNRSPSSSTGDDTERWCAIEMKLGYETGHGGWGLGRGDPSSAQSAETLLDLHVGRQLLFATSKINAIHVWQIYGGLVIKSGCVMVCKVIMTVEVAGLRGSER